MPFFLEPLVDALHLTRAAGFTACSSGMADRAVQYSKEKIQEISQRSATKLRSRVYNKPGQVSMEEFQKMANEQGKEFAKEIYGELVEVFTESEKLFPNYRLYFTLSKEKAAEWAKSLIKFMVTDLDFKLKMTVALLNQGKNGFKYEPAKMAANEFTSAMTFWVEMRVFRRREITGNGNRKHQIVQPQEA